MAKLLALLLPFLIAAAPLDSSVRIHVVGASIGTGTAYEYRDGKTYIITCAHVFPRSNPERYSIRVERFEGNRVVEAHPAKLVSYDRTYDCGLIVVDAKLPVTPLANSPAVPGEAVESVGCSRGAPPTHWKGMRVLRGNQNRIQVSRPPYPGRSGGGLFRASKAEIVGVCNTTDWIYSGAYCGLAPLKRLDARAPKKTGIVTVGYRGTESSPNTRRAGLVPNQGEYRGHGSRYGGWFMSAEKEQRYRRLFPETADPRVNAMLTSEDLILYTDEEIPLARQIWNTVSSGVHSPVYDISGGADHIGRGSAHEFPWKDPMGTHDVPAAELVKVRAMLLPRKDDGTFWPIAYYTQQMRFPANRVPAYKRKVDWVFPVGTVFFECLARKLPNGEVVTFELRLRERTKTHWEVDAFRPYTQWKDLFAKLKSMGQEDLASTLETPTRFRSARMHDTFHPHRQELNVSGKVEQLPDFSPELVEALTKGQVYYSASGQKWRDDVVAPAGGINPARYQAIVPVDSESCNDCHKSTNTNVDFFHNGRDWYGNTRGSDRIISFHIFDPACISYNGFSQRVQYRRELINWGMLQPYSDNLPADVYNPLD